MLLVELPSTKGGSDYDQQNNDRQEGESAAARILRRTMSVGIDLLLGELAEFRLFFPGRLHVVGDRLFLIDSQILSVSADKTLVENPAGQKIKLLLFHGP